MTAQQLSASPVYRRAYACGRALKRVFLCTRAIEARLADRAGRAGVPAGKVLVHGGSLVAALMLVVALVLVASVLIAALLALLAACMMVYLAHAESGSTHEDTGPDYLGTDLYIGNYDDHGNYIGQCKSSRHNSS